MQRFLHHSSKYALILLLILGSAALQAQILHPANWQHKFAKDTVRIGDEVDLIFDVTIDETWYLYSTDFDPDLGPKVTEFTFTPHPSYELVGNVRPIDAKEAYDDIFEGNYTYFRTKGEFRQKIKVLKAGLTIEGAYDYQVCTDVDGKCIPFDEDFSFEGLVVLSETGALIDKPEITPKDSLEPDQKGSNQTKMGGLTSRSSNAPYSPLAFMFAAFLAGLLALMTPCVYPMIPMTVTFFTNPQQSRKKGILNALLYGLSIVLIFTLLGTAVTLVFGADFANWLATHWLPNLIFFAMFVFFALWFLGAFEITLPSGLVNKVDQKSESGGVAGVFFMALTLVLVSFSCTGPIVGSILIESANGHVLKPVLGMIGYSLAFALTFSAFAIFPQWLSTLPKSGGWLNSVKVVLGFLELALSLKFLSMVDQVYHWGILDRDVFIAIWMAIFGALAGYLLGFIKLSSHDQGGPISIPRLLMALLVIAFTVYLTPGLWGAPLKPLAGILPPLTSQDFQPSNQMGVGEISQAENQLCSEPKYADILHLPHGLQGYFDLDQALDCAREQDKPVFIDFTGHACVNCRDMEAVVWSHPQVLEKLRNDFIVVALYVDEKTQLPENLWYTSEYDNKLKKTMGKQNADLQIKWYNNNAQPFYVLLDPDDPQTPLVNPIGYEKNISEFVGFLDQGLARYHEGQTAEL